VIRTLAALLGVALIGLACSTSSPNWSIPSAGWSNPFAGWSNPFAGWRWGKSGVERSGAHADDAVGDHVERLASVFYSRASSRRFNSVSTFHDPGLREFFASEESFADYFANFVEVLTDGHFERNRVIQVRLEEIVFEDPSAALVRVRLWGDNAQPLRWWRVNLLREDRWVSEEGRWWIVPGKL
jgi:hypothetical protein